MYGPNVTILFMYGSHDMRHTCFLQVDGGQRDPWDLGHHTFTSVIDMNKNIIPHLLKKILNLFIH